MEVIDGPFGFTGFGGDGEPLLTDPDQPCCSSYVPTPINISTEGPTTKKQKVVEDQKLLLLQQVNGYQNHAHYQ